MSIRHAVLAFSLSLMGLAAQAGTTSVFVGGEAGFVDQPAASSLTREQVRQEFQAFRRNPALNNGATVYVGGEQGWVDRPVSTTTRAAVRQELLARSAALAAAHDGP